QGNVGEAPSSLIRRFARSISNHILRGKTSEMVNGAVAELAQQDLAAHPEIERWILSAAFSGANSVHLKKVVRDLPLLVDARASLTVREVVWVTALPQSVSLRELDSADHR